MTERISVSGLRTLGSPVKPKTSRPKREPAQKALADKARRVLRGEFRKALELKAKLAAEQQTSADEKGRDAGESEKLRSIVASLEGMSRFVIAMGILTPAENREIWSEFIGQGLYEGWR